LPQEFILKTEFHTLRYDLLFFDSTAATRSMTLQRRRRQWEKLELGVRQLLGSQLT
jgi:hypothetical protein